MDTVKKRLEKVIWKYLDSRGENLEKVLFFWRGEGAKNVK